MKARAACCAAAAAAWLLLGSAAGYGDSNAGGLDELMALFAQRRHAEADFSEQKFLSVLKQPLQSSGQLIYDAPDHLEERTLTPRPQSLVLDQGVLSMKMGTHSRTLRLADYPQIAPLIDSIRATLAGDRAQLERTFSVQFAGDLDHWQMHLTPHDASSELTQIDLSGERDSVAEVRMQQRDGDRSVMRITPRS
jgi:hypothetical protein